ncbi:hypothetical protein [Paraburkholderia unamae]|uniref:hypothetical protein n=1 Tax=Paraburkholderia unamae TaxID=219649 RepID=UPI0010576F62|nr:hypothetical protein [Paraburkholderia unamae]
MDHLGFGFGGGVIGREIGIDSGRGIGHGGFFIGFCEACPLPGKGKILPPSRRAPDIAPARALDADYRAVEFSFRRNTRLIFASRLNHCEFCNAPFRNMRLIEAIFWGAKKNAAREPRKNR